MPAALAAWQQRIPNLHFHYDTTTPEQGSRLYQNFLDVYYPQGSLDIRSLNFTTADQILKVRNTTLIKVLQAFPQRKFILLADTSNGDVMKDYPAAAASFSNVQCILLRNTSATDSGDHFPYDTSGFKTLSNSSYMFFRTPDDVLGLDFSKGDCRNASVPQNVTFAYQGLPAILPGSASTLAASALAASAALVAALLCL